MVNTRSQTKAAVEATSSSSAGTTSSSSAGTTSSSSVGTTSSSSAGTTSSSSAGTTSSSSAGTTSSSSAGTTSSSSVGTIASSSAGINSLTDKLCCCVCQEFPRLEKSMKVRCCSNGHIVCTMCCNSMENVSNSSVACPYCRDTITETIPGSLISRLVASSGQIVTCRHGCGMNGSLELLADHEAECVNGMVKCSFNSCEEMVTTKNLPNHQRKCNFRPARCPRCSNYIQPSDWFTTHPGCFSNLDRITSQPVGIGQRPFFVLLGMENNSPLAFARILWSYGFLVIEVFGKQGLDTQMYKAEVVVVLEGEEDATIRVSQWDSFMAITEGRINVGKLHIRIPSYTRISKFTIKLVSS